MKGIIDKVSKLEELANNLKEIYRSNLENEIKIVTRQNISISNLETSGKGLGFEFFPIQDYFFHMKDKDFGFGTIFPFKKMVYIYFLYEDLTRMTGLQRLFTNKGYIVFYTNAGGSPKDLINEIRKFCLGSPPMTDV